MQLPQGFQLYGTDNVICKLQKSLYGLKKFPVNSLPSFLQNCWESVINNQRRIIPCLQRQPTTLLL